MPREASRWRSAAVAAAEGVAVALAAIPAAALMYGSQLDGLVVPAAVVPATGFGLATALYRAL